MTAIESATDPEYKLNKESRCL